MTHYELNGRRQDNRNPYRSAALDVSEFNGALARHALRTTDECPYSDPTLYRDGRIDPRDFHGSWHRGYNYEAAYEHAAELLSRTHRPIPKPHDAA